MAVCTYLIKVQHKTNQTGHLPGDFLATKQALIKLIQRNIDLHHVVIALLDEVADDQVEFAAVGQGVACSADQILGFFQIQFQSNGKSDSRRF